MVQICHYNISITGFVQGVGYRYTAVRTARSMGISGFVRNQQDGSVYIEAEGKQEQLDKLIIWCYQGPPGARVDNIHFEKSAIRHFKGFDVK